MDTANLIEVRGKDTSLEQIIDHVESAVVSFGPGLHGVALRGNKRRHTKALHRWICDGPGVPNNIIKRGDDVVTIWFEWENVLTLSTTTAESGDWQIRNEKAVS